MKILVEETVDSMDFAELVCEELCRLNLSLCNRVQSVVSLQGADLNEVKRYLNGIQPDWDFEKQRMLLNRLAETGHKVDAINLEKAFSEVRVVQVKAGDVLIERGTPSHFVYIPFAEGLCVCLLENPVPLSVPSWIQVGNIEVIRASIRQERVIAEQSLSLLMIPQEIYLRYWYTPYNVQEFTSLCTSEAMKCALHSSL